jgi:hypothetical protein
MAFLNATLKSDTGKLKRVKGSEVKTSCKFEKAAKNITSLDDKLSLLELSPLELGVLFIFMLPGRGE